MVIYPSIHSLTVHLSSYPPIHPSICVPIHPFPIHLSTYPALCLSIHGFIQQRFLEQPKSLLRHVSAHPQISTCCSAEPLGGSRRLSVRASTRRHAAGGHSHHAGGHRATQEPPICGTFVSTPQPLAHLSGDSQGPPYPRGQVNGVPPQRRGGTPSFLPIALSAGA